MDEDLAAVPLRLSAQQKLRSDPLNGREGLSDVSQRQPVLLKNSLQPFQRLSSAFTPEHEGFKMDRQEVLCSCVIRHGNCLFGVAVRTNPRFVGTDWHNCQLIRTPIPQWPKRRCPCRIAAKNDLLSFPLDDIAVVAAVLVMLPPCSPM